jgi:hypothetical protein
MCGERFFIHQNRMTSQELEDQNWLKEADAARAEGFAGQAEVETLLARFESVDNEYVRNSADE